MNINWRFLVLIISLLVVCQGCSFHRAYYEKVQLMTVADYNAMKIIKQLEKQDVQVFSYRPSRGDSKDLLGTMNVQIKNPTVFNEASANFNSNAVNILDKIVALLNCYEEESVKVQSGHNSKVAGNMRYNKALMLERAHRISQYLWSQNVNATFLYATSDTIPKDSVAIVFKKFRRD